MKPDLFGRQYKKVGRYFNENILKVSKDYFEHEVDCWKTKQELTSSDGRVIRENDEMKKLKYLADERSSTAYIITILQVFLYLQDELNIVPTIQ